MVKLTRIKNGYRCMACKEFKVDNFLNTCKDCQKKLGVDKNGRTIENAASDTKS